MSDFPRRMAAQLRRFLGNRRMAKRVRARLNFTLTLEDPRLNGNGFRRLPPLKGHTTDISTTGLALIVPTIRISEHYLAGIDKRLFVRLELENETVDIQERNTALIADHLTPVPAQKSEHQDLLQATRVSGWA